MWEGGREGGKLSQEDQMEPHHKKTPEESFTQCAVGNRTFWRACSSPEITSRQETMVALHKVHDPDTFRRQN